MQKCGSPWEQRPIKILHDSMWNVYLVTTFKKKSHNLCVSKERLIADEEQRLSCSLMAFPLVFLIFVLCSFFSVPAEQVTQSKGQCSPWRSTPWCGQSCRSCRGCAHPRGSSLGYLLQTGDHRNPRTVKTDGNDASKNVKYICGEQMIELSIQGLHNVATYYPSCFTFC